MYGFVNHALELLVIRNYGPAVWEDIKTRKKFLKCSHQMLVETLILFLRNHYGKYLSFHLTVVSIHRANL